MPITDLASLTETAIRWTGYGDGVPVPARISNAALDAVGMAEADLSDTLRVQEMIKRSVFIATEEWASVPPDLVKLIAVSLLKDGAEFPMTEVAAIDLPGWGSAYTGDPSWFALVGLQLRFAPAPTTTAPMTGRITYFARLDPLSSAAPCTAALLMHPNVYLYATLKHLSLYTDDAQAQAKWEAMQQAEVQQANKAAALKHLSLG